MKHTFRCLAVCLMLWAAAGKSSAEWVTTTSGGPWTAVTQPAQASAQLHVGDMVTILLPGEPSLNKDFQVDRLGQILLPEVGAITLSGLTLEEAQEAVKARLATAFRDLERLNVKLKERRILVHVGGFVKQPGLIDLPGDATVQNALALAGGLAEGAQLDRLQLRRDKETIVFDYKKYLETGDAAHLPALMPLDTIFVPSSPVIGNVYVNFDGRTLAQAGDASDEHASIKIFGEVNTPASYAFRPGATIIDMLLRAGGVTRYGATEQIRIIAKGEPVLFNLQRYLDTGDLRNMPALTPGATIFVPKQVEEIRTGARTVYVMGEVAKPGAFETQNNATFIEILANSGGPTRFADTRHIKVIKADGSVELADLVAFTEDPKQKLPALKAGDAIFVPEKVETTEPSWLKVHPNRAVELMGAVNKPGRYEWSDEMSIFDLLAAAGGPAAKADLSHIQILEKKEGSAVPSVFDAKKFLLSGGAMAGLPKIRAGAIIMVPELLSEIVEDRGSIKVFGEVNTPATFPYKPGASIIDVLMKSGGVTRFAAPEQIRILTQNGPVLFNLQNYLDTGDPKLLPELAPGATVYVPKQVEEIKKGAHTVYIMGEVAKPGAFESHPGTTFIEILANAGGPSRFADTRHVRLIRANGAVEQADLVKYTESGGGKLPDIFPGDAIFIPEKTEINEASWLKIKPQRAIEVIGAVTRPGRYEWSDEMSIFDLLGNAGGPSQRADMAKIQILESSERYAASSVFDAKSFILTGGPVSKLPKLKAGYVISVPELPVDVIDNKAQWLKIPQDESIYVMGEVGKPGRYAFQKKMTFLDIVTAADGPTSKADLTNIRVSLRRRGAPQVERVNLQRYFLTGDEKLLPKLRAGDVIYVPDQTVEFAEAPRRDVVYVLGAVGKPGKYPFSDYMTILDLISAAGGTSSTALQDRILIVNMSGIERKATYFNLPKFAKTANTQLLPVVRPGDVVYVPDQDQDDVKMLANFVNNISTIASPYLLFKPGTATVASTGGK
jgi:protein involved in polysaccharide export with SLBB domain